MTRTDSLVVGTLVVLLALIAGLVGVPVAPRRPTAVARQPEPGACAASPRPYREGVLGPPVSVSPLTARTPGRPRPRRPRLLRASSGTARTARSCPTSPSAGRSTPTGTIWTFQLRARRALAGRRAGHRRRRRRSRSDVLQDPAYTGPAPGRGTRSRSTADGPPTVRFTLTTPLGGFLQAATQPIAPAHLLADIPVDGLADDPFGRQPIGSGPFAVASLDDDTRRARSRRRHRPRRPRRPTAAPSAARDRFARDARPDRPPEPARRRTCAGIELQLLRRRRRARRGLSRGRARRRLRPVAATAAATSATTPGQPAPPLPGLDADRGRSSTCGPATRSSPTRRSGRALLEAIDRPAIIVRGLRAATASRADRPDPADVVRCSTRRPSPPVAVRPGRRGEAALKAAGWTKAADGWHLPKAKAPLTHRAAQPGPGIQPGRLRRRRGRGRRDWRRSASTVDPRRRSPRRVRHGPARDGQLHGGRRRRRRSASTRTSIRCSPRARPGPAARTSSGSRIRPSTSSSSRPAAPGTDGRPRGGLFGASRSSSRRAATCSRWPSPDESSWSATRLTGPSVRQVADPADRFWDVLTWRLAAGR